MRRLHHLRQWGTVAVLLAVGCGDDKRPVMQSNAGASGAATSGGSSADRGQAGSDAPAGNGGSSEAAASSGAGGEGVGADSGGASVAGAAHGGAAGEEAAGAGGVPFGCMPNAAACPEELPENMATCVQTMADVGIFCAYGSCTQACVCNGMQTGSEPTFAWLCFPIGM